MVAGLRSCLAAAGVDVAYEVAKAALVLSSDQSHLSDRRFNIARMMARLEDAIDQALSDRYRGYGPLATWAGSSVPKAISPCSSNTNGDLKSCFGVSRRCAAFASITLTHFRRRRCGVLMHPSIFVRTNGSIAHTGNQSDSIAIRTELRPLRIMTASGAIWSTELHFSSLFGVRSFWPRRSLPPLIEHPAELDVGVVALRGLLTLGTQPSVDSKG